MIRRFTYLLAGVMAVTVAVPATALAQARGANIPPGEELVKVDRGYNYGKQAKRFLPTKQAQSSPRHASGKTYNVPYLEEFNDEASFNDFTVIDANSDQSTWSYSSEEQSAYYEYSSKNAADDWLITPSINLSAGRTYIVAFKARNNGTRNRTPERIEAKWGQGTTVADMTEELAPSTELKGKVWKVFRNIITPSTTGTYNFGFHAISDKDQYELYLDSISVTQVIQEAAPDSVTNLVAVPDAGGALKVTLTFNAPSMSINNTELTSLDSIVVRKGNSLVEKLTAVSPGAAETVVDNNAAIGTNNYTVIAYNGSGEGRIAQVSAIAGPDAPKAPEVTATDNLTSVTLSWPTVEGVKGGVIVPSEVSYDIFNANSEGYPADSITTVTGVNEYTLNINTTEGKQSVKGWTVRARNAYGSSRYGSASLLMGAPYTLPFSNSLAHATLEGQYIGMTKINYQTKWVISTVEASDNDGGSLHFTNDYYGSTYPGQAYVTTGKIGLQGTQNPQLIFSYKGANARLVAEVEHKDGTVDSLWTESFPEAEENSYGVWKTAKLALPASVGNEPYSKIRFRGIADNNSQADVFVDDIHVIDPYTNDAAISLTAPSHANKGQSVSMKATVTNMGSDNLSNLEVKITVNDEVVKDTTISRQLALFDNVEIPVSYKTTSLKDVASLTVKAEVVNPTDMDDSNNSATATVALQQETLNAPANLQGSASEGTVLLSWDAPEQSYVNTADGFEDYTAWLTDNVGDWTFLNCDSAAFGPVTRYRTEPNYGVKAAYEVWRPDDIFKSEDRVNPHSGDQCLASIYKIDGDEKPVDADDWLISPELSGQAQTVSFWVNNVNGVLDDGTAYGTETFQVLASTTDKDTASFTQVGTDYTQSSEAWTQIFADLPAGTKYFAIRRITNGISQYLFFIDDVNYVAGHNVVSYNIYVDGELAGNTTATTYSADNDGADHTYSVTAVYADGSESEPATIDLVANSIDDIHAQLKADKYDVYTIGGAQVKIGAKSLNGLAPGVYVINGKKVLLK